VRSLLRSLASGFFLLPLLRTLASAFFFVFFTIEKKNNHQEREKKRKEKKKTKFSFETQPENSFIKIFMAVVCTSKKFLELTRSWGVRELSNFVGQKPRLNSCERIDEFRVEKGSSEIACKKILPPDISLRYDGDRYEKGASNQERCEEFLSSFHKMCLCGLVLDSDLHPKNKTSFFRDFLKMTASSPPHNFLKV